MKLEDKFRDLKCNLLFLKSDQMLSSVLFLMCHGPMIRLLLEMSVVFHLVELAIVWSWEL